MILLLAKSLFAGAMLGAVFTLLHLPIPAPNVLAGVFGIIGVYAGYAAVNWLWP